MKLKLCLQKHLLFLRESLSVFDEKIFVNIQAGFAVIYRLCLRNKDSFAEVDFLQKS